jgi:hypothetical protein
MISYILDILLSNYLFLLFSGGVLSTSGTNIVLKELKD